MPFFPSTSVFRIRLSEGRDFSFQVRRTTTPICHIYSFTPEKEKPPKQVAEPIKHRVFYYDFWRHLVNSMSGQEGNGRKIPSPPVSSPLSSHLNLIRGDYQERMETVGGAASAQGGRQKGAGRLWSSRANGVIDWFCKKKYSRDKRN